MPPPPRRVCGAPRQVELESLRLHQEKTGGGNGVEGRERVRLLLDPHALLDGRKGGRGPSLPPPRSAHSHTILQYYTHSRTRMHRRRRRAGWLLISPDRPSPFYPPPTHTPVPPQRRRKGAEVRWGRRGGGGGGNDLGLGSSPSHCHRLRAPPCSRVRGGRWINSFFRTCSAHTHMGGRTKGRSVLFEFPPQRGGEGRKGPLYLGRTRDRYSCPLSTYLL